MLADSGKKIWASCVQTNLQSLDIGDHSTSVKDALRTLWETLGRKMLKVEGNRSLKCIPEAECYTKAMSIRRIMAGLRAGCLPLQVELGKLSLQKTPLKERAPCI